jgi:hypothetical protein
LRFAGFQLNRRQRIAVKHFINRDLVAPNVLTVPVDYGIVSEFAELAADPDPGPDYFTRIPWPDVSDMRWTSGATRRSFERFEQAFHQLQVADAIRDYVDLASEVRYFTGFIYTRRHTTDVNMHVDWRANNEAFTLITPISGPADRLKLTYQTMKGDLADYSYRLGEAIIFGDYFTHSSPIGNSDTPTSMLVLHFGTDKMEHWDNLIRPQRWQAPLVQRPDGTFIRVDPSTGDGDTDTPFDRQDLA